MKSNLFFIIGIRRSGTSILRELIMKHPQVMGCEFEPHDLWAAVDLSHFPRLMQMETPRTFTQMTITQFNMFGCKAAKEGKWYGAKFALNPGVKALEWVWLKKTFPDARFIFILRNFSSTWNSYCKQDRNSVRGTITESAYRDECPNILQTFKKNNHGNGLLIEYKGLAYDANYEMNKIFSHLNLPMPNINFKQFIKQPEF